MPVCEAASISITSMWRPSMIAAQCSPSPSMSMVGCVDLAGDGVVEGAGEDAGGGRLADAAHAGEHVGLRDAAGAEGVGQRADHRLLADEVGEALRAVFAGEHPVGAVPAAILIGAVHHPPLGQGESEKPARDPRRNSLGLLPSGPDPVGEGRVRGRLPEGNIGLGSPACKGDGIAIHGRVRLPSTADPVRGRVG